MPVFEFKYVVSMRDTDATGLVFHPRYLEMLSMAREDLIENLGFDFNMLSSQFNTLLVVHSINLNFKTPAFLRQKLNIRSTILRVNNAKIILNQEICSAELSAKIIMTANIVIAHVCKKTFTPTLIPAEILARLI